MSFLLKVTLQKMVQLEAGVADVDLKFEGYLLCAAARRRLKALL